MDRHEVVAGRHDHLHLHLGQAGWVRQDGSGRAGQAGRVRQGRSGRAGQAGRVRQGGSGRAGQAGRVRQGGSGRASQAGRGRRIKPSQGESTRDRVEKVAGKVWPQLKGHIVKNLYNNKRPLTSRRATASNQQPTKKLEA